MNKKIEDRKKEKEQRVSYSEARQIALKALEEAKIRQREEVEKDSFDFEYDLLEESAITWTLFDKESQIVASPTYIREDVPMSSDDITHSETIEGDWGITMTERDDTIHPPPGFSFTIMDNTIYISCSCWWCKLKGWIKGIGNKKEGGKNESN